MKIIPLKMTFAITLLGILVLIIISTILQPPLVTIASISSKSLNQNLKISGHVTSSKIFEDSNFQLITLQDKTGNITITLNSLIKITNNQSLTVMGKVIEYENTLEIQAEKITLNS